jgi:hypothetical protein
MDASLPRANPCSSSRVMTALPNLMTSRRAYFSWLRSVNIGLRCSLTVWIPRLDTPWTKPCVPKLPNRYITRSSTDFSNGSDKLTPEYLSFCGLNLLGAWGYQWKLHQQENLPFVVLWRYNHVNIAEKVVKYIWMRQNVRKIFIFMKANIINDYCVIIFFHVYW